MNRENIIRMAREAGVNDNGIATRWFDDWLVLERFAALVAAAAIKDAPDYKMGYADGVAAEREACAKVCEMEGYKYRERVSELNPIKRDINPEVARIANMTCDFNARAIRARGSNA